MLVGAPFVWTVTVAAVLITAALMLRRRRGWMGAVMVATSGGMAFAVAADTVARPADVYLPPAWFRPDHPRLPVIMLLHGTPGGPSDWTRSAQADVVADQFAKSRAGMAPVLVFPDANGGPFKDTECVDGPKGR